MNVAAIVQARMGSSRLPGKVLMPILGQPMLGLLLYRIRKAENVDRIVVATSTNQRDDAIACLAMRSAGVYLFRGPEEDVLSRYYKAATEVGAEIILRVTADNPLFDPELADTLISKVISGSCDYASNNLVRSYPYGLDLEAFTFDALKVAFEQTVDPALREHVTSYMRENPSVFNLCGVELETDISSMRLTVDTRADYIRMKSIFERFGSDVTFREVVSNERS